MSRDEWVATLQNVASDLQAIAEQMAEDIRGPNFSELVKDAKLAVEHVTHDDPHL